MKNYLKIVFMITLVMNICPNKSFANQKDQIMEIMKSQVVISCIETAQKDKNYSETKPFMECSCNRSADLLFASMDKGEEYMKKVFPQKMEKVMEECAKKYPLAKKALDESNPIRKGCLQNVKDKMTETQAICFCDEGLRLESLGKSVNQKDLLRKCIK